MLEMLKHLFAENSLHGLYVFGLLITIWLFVFFKTFKGSLGFTSFNEKMSQKHFRSGFNRKDIFSERSWDFKTVMVFKETLLRGYNLIATKLRTLNHSERWCSLLHLI